jgi:hypothetical protein
MVKHNSKSVTSKKRKVGSTTHSGAFMKKKVKDDELILMPSTSVSCLWCQQFWHWKFPSKLMCQFNMLQSGTADRIAMSQKVDLCFVSFF